MNQSTLPSRYHPNETIPAPNQPLQPSHSAVTPRAGARVAPAGVPLKRSVRLPHAHQFKQEVPMAEIRVELSPVIDRSGQISFYVDLPNGRELGFLRSDQPE